MLNARQTAFRNHVTELARRIAPEFELDWRIMAATAILESGWGESELARNANNFFGIRAARSTPDDETWTLSSPAGPQRFRRYKSDEQAFRAYGKLVGDSELYAKARHAARDTAFQAFVRSLAPTYCPDDPDYALKILQIVELLEPEKPA